MSRRAKRFAAAAALLLYLALLARLLIFKIEMLRIGRLRFRFAMETGAPNLSPFKTIGSYLQGGRLSSIALLNVAGNIVLFVPVGFLAAVVFPALRWPACLTLALTAGLAIEVAQSALGVGIFDIDDVILNALGVMIGYWTSLVLRKPDGAALTPLP
jgi:glycopeptide antibiotics resistance protein